MNILFIFGNGFDKAQGMHTSYPEFYEYLNSKKDELSVPFQELLNEINSNNELWSDMEEAFGKYTSKIQNAQEFENLYFDICDNLQDYLEIQEENFNPSEELRKKFESDLCHIEEYLMGGDQERYISFKNEWVGDQQIRVMTFNYTDTFEKLLSLGSDTSKIIKSNVFLQDVVHVHGKLGNTIILGVDNERQIGKKEFHNNQDVTDLLVKEQSNIAIGVLRHIRCEELISNANVIVLYGVSLGETDARWRKYIGYQFFNRTDLCIIQHIYKNDMISPRRLQKIKQLKRIQIERWKKMMDINDEEWSDDYEERLFLFTKPNLFTLKEESKG